MDSSVSSAHAELPPAAHHPHLFDDSTLMHESQSAKEAQSTAGRVGSGVGGGVVGARVAGGVGGAGVGGSVRPDPSHSGFQNPSNWSKQLKAPLAVSSRQACVPVSDAHHPQPGLMEHASHVGWMSHGTSKSHESGSQNPESSEMQVNWLAAVVWKHSPVPSKPTHHEQPSRSLQVSQSDTTPHSSGTSVQLGGFHSPCVPAKQENWADEVWSTQAPGSCWPASSGASGS
mmetsp:Transcript_9143/g.29085  ORF Transcript_9143/g.29085 Transcript_9143/m.29085 type:complete len:230 (+) Transcript_9143:4242-4931(+)